MSFLFLSLFSSILLLLLSSERKSLGCFLGGASCGENNSGLSVKPGLDRWANVLYLCTSGFSSLPRLFWLQCTSSRLVTRIPPRPRQIWRFTLVSSLNGWLAVSILGMKKRHVGAGGANDASCLICATSNRFARSACS